MAENTEKETIKQGKLALTMLKMMGMDIVAPKELSTPIIKELNLDNNEKFINTMIELRDVEGREAYEIIKGLVISKLSAGYILKLAHFAGVFQTSLVEYGHEHPEVRDEINKDNIMDILADAMTAEWDE